MRFKDVPFGTVRSMLLIAVLFALGVAAPIALGQQAAPRFRVIAIAEKGGIHKPFVDSAKVWLAREGTRDGFTVDYIEDTSRIDDAFLSNYQLFIQLNFPPYAWTPRAMAAFERYIDEGRGGWIGFHHATLLGEFDGYPMWPWFSNFMGGIRFTKYIPTFATGTVSVEASQHPVMKGLPAHFIINRCISIFMVSKPLRHTVFQGAERTIALTHACVGSKS